jgi:hypothetical protein
MAQTYPLPRGPRVRLRLATPHDEASIRALADRCDADPQSLDIAGLVGFDPRERAVICATALLDAVETIVGVGAIELRDGTLAPMLVDHELTDGLGDLLSRALIGRVNALQRVQAA